MDCAICLVELGGTTRITAGCGHTFHLACVQGLANHGHTLCPQCRAPFSVLLPRAGDPAPDAPPARAVVANRALQLSFLCTETATGKCAGVVVLNAPHEGHRVGVDLVVLADVSGSMVGRKITLLRESLRFLIGELTPRDRLCVVPFNDHATPLAPLKPMNDENKAALAAECRVLDVRGGTDIGAALLAAHRVLSARRSFNDTAMVLLLSDGQDAAATSTGVTLPLVCCVGIGSDHDAFLLKELSARSGGTFAYAPSDVLIPATVGAALGAATSTVATEVRLKVKGEEELVGAFTDGQTFYHPFSSDVGLPVTVVLTYKDNGGNAREAHAEFDGVTMSETSADLIDSHMQRRLFMRAIKSSVDMARGGDMSGARDALRSCKETIEASRSAATELCASLVADLNAQLERLVDSRTYHQSGGAATGLARMTSHTMQRATGDGLLYATQAVADATQRAVDATQGV